MSERSTTPSRELTEEPIEQEEKVLRTRKISTPKKAGRASPNPNTPKRSRRISGGTGNEAVSVTVLETLVEDDEEKNDDVTHNSKIAITLGDVLRSEAQISVSPKSSRITRSKRYHMIFSALTSSNTFSQ